MGDIFKEARARDRSTMSTGKTADEIVLTKGRKRPLKEETDATSSSSDSMKVSQ